MQPGKLKYKPTPTKSNNEGFFETLLKGRHFSFLSVKTKYGKKEVIARNNHEFYACKVLPLIIQSEDVKSLNLDMTKCSVDSFSKIIFDNDLLGKIKVPLFTVARPITKFFEKNLSSLDIYELPGGVVGNNEDFELGGVRELMEELGIDQNQILTHTILLDPCAFDSGSHVELMGIIAVLLHGDIKPVNWESIKGEETKVVPFTELTTFLKIARKEKKLVEGYIEYAILLLNRAIDLHRSNYA